MQERRFVFAITVVACSLYLQNSSSKFFFSGMEEGTLSSSSHTRTSPLAFGQGESLQLVAANVLPVGEFSVFMEIKQNHVWVWRRPGASTMKNVLGKKKSQLSSRFLVSYARNNNNSLTLCQILTITILRGRTNLLYLWGRWGFWEVK